MLLLATLLLLMGTAHSELCQSDSESTHDREDFKIAMRRAAKEYAASYGTTLNPERLEHGTCFRRQDCPDQPRGEMRALKRIARKGMKDDAAPTRVLQRVLSNLKFEFRVIRKVCSCNSHAA